VRHVMTLAASATMLVALTACGDDSPESSATTETSTETSTEDCPESTDAVVSETGGGPRRLLELSPTPGTTQAFDMTMNLDIAVESDGTDMGSQSSPPITLGMKVTVDRVEDDEIEMTFVYDDISVEGGDPAIQSQLDPMIGVSGTLTTTRNGAFIDGSLDDPEGLDPTLATLVDQMEQQMASFSFPLPTEPVGVGGAWSVDTSFELSGVVSCTHTTYRLRSFDGQNYELETTVDQELLPGAIDQAGASVEVVGGGGTIQGTSTGSLTFPMALESSARGTTRTEMTVDADGEEHSQNLTTNVEVNLTRR